MEDTIVLSETGIRVSDNFVTASLADALQAKYELLCELGRGGMAVVYKARHRLTERYVAIKILHNQDDLSLKRFAHEAKTAMALAHPNLVAVHDFDICDGTAYLVMEHVEGKSLAAVLESERRLSVERVKRIGLGVCAGLEYAHAAGVVHRDIKPSNVMLTTVNGEEIAKLTDFGIARHVEEVSQKLTQTGEIIGSPLYLSPEQCAGQPGSMSSDIYALGCLLYEALSGKPPLAGQNFLETVHLRTTASAQPLRDLGFKHIDPNLDAAILECLAMDAAERMPSAADLARSIRECETKKPKRQKKRKAARGNDFAKGVAVGALCIVFMLGWWITSNRHKLVRHVQHQMEMYAAPLPSDPNALYAIATNPDTPEDVQNAAFRELLASSNIGVRASALIEIAERHARKGEIQEAQVALQQSLENWNTQYPKPDYFLAYGQTRAAEVYRKLGLKEIAAQSLTAALNTIRQLPAHPSDREQISQRNKEINRLAYEYQQLYQNDRAKLAVAMQEIAKLENLK